LRIHFFNLFTYHYLEGGDTKRRKGEGGKKKEGKRGKCHLVDQRPFGPSFNGKKKRKEKKGRGGEKAHDALYLSLHPSTNIPYREERGGGGGGKGREEENMVGFPLFQYTLKEK